MAHRLVAVTTESADPRAIRSIAVTAGDVVAAYEANRGAGPRTVLRVTPPFSGLMRARLHRTVEDSATENPPPVHVDPADLLAEEAPAYPHPDETEDALRADPDAEYTPERHHERHRVAVRRWRERVRGHLVDAATLETPEGPHRVAVTVLDGRG